MLDVVATYWKESDEEGAVCGEDSTGLR